jgi:hypothetical protein
MASRSVVQTHRRSEASLTRRYRRRRSPPASRAQHEPVRPENVERGVHDRAQILPLSADGIWRLGRPGEQLTPTAAALRPAHRRSRWSITPERSGCRHGSSAVAQGRRVRGHIVERDVVAGEQRRLASCSGRSSPGRPGVNEHPNADEPRVGPISASGGRDVRVVQACPRRRFPGLRGELRRRTWCPCPRRCRRPARANAIDTGEPEVGARTSGFRNRSGARGPSHGVVRRSRSQTWR